MGCHLLNSDGYDPNLNLLNSGGSLADDSHNVLTRLIGRAPTSEEIRARLQNALNTPTKPGYGPANPPVLNPDNSYWGPTRTPKAEIENQWSGNGRREENIPELPPYLAINGQETSAYSAIGKARDNRDKMEQIAERQLPGSMFRRDASRPRGS